MDKEAVFSSDFEGNLSCGFKKRLGFDIAYRAAYFGYDNVGVGLFSDSRLLYGELPERSSRDIRRGVLCLRRSNILSLL